MGKLSFAGKACIVSLAVLCMGALAACSGSSDSDGTHTGGVAATVNGVEIAEDDVTDAVIDARDYYLSYSYYLTGEEPDTSDETAMWTTFLEYKDESPEDLRLEYLDQFIDKELLFQYADELGVDVTDEEIDQCVDDIRSNFDTDEQWKDALEERGWTEEYYREDVVKYNLVYQAALDSFGEDEDEDEDEDEGEPEDSKSGSDEADDSEDTSDEVTEEELVEYAQENAAADYDGAKRSSHVLFDIEDEDTAKDVLAQIKAGVLDISDAAKRYSTDSASASDGGDVGWDCLNQFVDEYQDALDELDKGEVSDLVESEYGYHIIECTDVFEAPDEITEVSTWPSDIVDDMEENLIEEKDEEATEAEEEAYDEWIEECRDKADIVINDMPEDVPYNIDITAEAEEGDEDEDADSDADAADDSDATADDSDATADDSSSSSDSDSASSSSSSSSDSSDANTSSDSGSDSDTADSDSSSSSSSSASTPSSSGGSSN